VLLAKKLEAAQERQLDAELQQQVAKAELRKEHVAVMRFCGRDHLIPIEGGPLEPVYGELGPISYERVLDSLFDNNTGTRSVNFVDVGSGRGKACYSATVLYPDIIDTVTGIECSSFRHNVACTEYERLNADRPHVTLLHLDIIEWTEGGEKTTHMFVFDEGMSAGTYAAIVHFIARCTGPVRIAITAKKAKLIQRCEEALEAEETDTEEAPMRGFQLRDSNLIDIIQSMKTVHTVKATMPRGSGKTFFVYEVAGDEEKEDEEEEDEDEEDEKGETAAGRAAERVAAQARACKRKRKRDEQSRGKR